MFQATYLALRRALRWPGPNPAPLAQRKRIYTPELVLVALLLGLSVLLRVWGFNYDLPYIYHPDEPSYVAFSQRIFQTGDLNPHFFNYPSLFFYINAVAYIPYYLFGKALGVFHTPYDILPPISLAMGVSRLRCPRLSY